MSSKPPRIQTIQQKSVSKALSLEHCYLQNLSHDSYVQVPCEALLQSCRRGHAITTNCALSTLAHSHRPGVQPLQQRMVHSLLFDTSRLEGAWCIGHAEYAQHAISFFLQSYCKTSLEACALSSRTYTYRRNPKNPSAYPLKTGRVFK